jgi:hypothetical protein
LHMHRDVLLPEEPDDLSVHGEAGE